MGQGLYSETLPEFAGEIENALLSDSIQGLSQLIGGGPLRILEWDENSIALSVAVPVELPPLGNFEDTDIRDSEPVLIRIDRKDYPNIPPMVFPDRLDFPKDRLAHLYVAKKGRPPGFCLVRGDLGEWYANKRLKDLYIRTSNWLRDAACGLLAENGEEFDPVRWEGYRGTMTYDYDQVAAVVNEKLGYEEGVNFAIALFERVGTESGISFKLSSLVTTETLESSVQEMKKEREKAEDNPAKKSYHFGYILWSEATGTYRNYSVDFPDDWDSFKKFCQQYGIPTLAFEKQIAENDRNVFVSIPVIVGVRRPKKIIGFSGDIEFFNFTIKVDTPDVDSGFIVANVPVAFYKHSQPLSRNRARAISGSPPVIGRFALIAGCGALGSKVVMHLARSGETNFILTDPDELLPHNLVRHALLGNSVGLNKAEALKKEINAIFPDEKMPLLASGKGSGSSLFEPAISKFFDWIFDFTASDAFGQTLVRTDFAAKPRIVKAYITNFGDLGLICFEGKDRNPRLDDLQILLYAQYKELPLITDWLTRESENSEQSNNLSITVGVGCNSETTILVDDIVSLHSAYTAGVIKAESVHEQSESGKIYLLEIKRDPFFSAVTRALSFPPLSVLTAINDPSWQIRIKHDILEAMKKEMELAGDHETGGVLVGCANFKTKTIHVTDLIRASADSSANEVCFFRGVEGLPEAIGEVNRQAGNQLGYIGEWHTHPYGPDGMSTTDAETVGKFKVEFNALPTPLPVFLLILTSTSVLPFVY
jgi:hypothetical protein